MPVLELDEEADGDVVVFMVDECFEWEVTKEAVEVRDTGSPNARVHATAYRAAVSGNGVEVKAVMVVVHCATGWVGGIEVAGFGDEFDWGFHGDLEVVERKKATATKGSSRRLAVVRGIQTSLL